MKRLTLGLTIALIAFLFGIVISGLLTVNLFRPTEKIPIAAPMIAELKVRVSPPDRWKKVDVDNKVSFYIPSDMEQFEMLDQIGYSAAPKLLLNKILQVRYDYIEKADVLLHTDLPCELSAGYPTDRPAYRSSEVVIDSRRATQACWQTDKPVLNRMTLCFPDIGDGTILHIGIASKDEQSLEVAKQILGTIKFHN